MNAADRLIGKAHDYEVLAASHSEREALVGGGEHLAVRLRSPSLRSSCARLLQRSRTSRGRMTGVDSFEVVGFGVDDMTLGLDMTVRSRFVGSTRCRGSIRGGVSG